MRRVVLIAAAVILAGIAGCGRRGHEDVQKGLTREAQELAKVMASDLDPKAKLEQVGRIADRMKALAEEARQLGNPAPGDMKRMDARYRDRDQKAAKGLAEAAARMQGSP